MSRFGGLLIPIAVVLFGPACDIGAIVDRDGRLDELDRRREQWRASGIEHYRIEFVAGCQCPYEFTQTVLVEVSGDAIVSVVMASTGLPAQQKPVDFWLTIEELFDAVERAIVDDADRLDVSYDPDLGYPYHVFVDRDGVMTDDEVGYRVSSLEVREQ